MIKFPRVRNVPPKTLAEDIKGFDPSNPKDVEEWGEMFKQLFTNIKKEFDAKGIPMPTITIDHTPGPIKYGIATKDKDGNIIHTDWNNDTQE